MSNEDSTHFETIPYQMQWNTKVLKIELSI